MKTPSNPFIRTCLAVAVALAMSSPSQILAAERGDGKPMAEGKGMEGCQAIKAERQKLKEDMKAQNAALTEQIAKMNSAPEDKKVALMAEVITTATEQRIAMETRKAQLQEKMMQHMMQHMQSGRESMAHCPMAKDDVNNQGTHQQHLDEATER